MNVIVELGTIEYAIFKYHFVIGEKKFYYSNG